jgi:hypothetical protein
MRTELVADMSAASAAVDFYDRVVDSVRAVLGWAPFPPAVLKLEFESPPTVRVPTALNVQYRRAVYAFLRIEQGGAALFEGPVPADGKVGVMPMTPAPIGVHLALESRDPLARHGTVVTETVFEPLANGPAIHSFTAPAQATFGDGIACAWSAPRAERVHLAVIEGNNAADHVLPATSQILLPPPGRPGRVLVRLTAECSWGQTTLTRAVDVGVPPVRLMLLREPLQYGEPGQKLIFEWRTDGADSVWLIEPDCEAPRKFDSKDGGLLAVTLGLEPTEFQVIARGYGGAEESVVLRAVPHASACLETGLR